MNKAITLYKSEEELQELKERLFVFEPLLSLNKDRIGYVRYDRYLIPLKLLAADSITKVESIDDMIYAVDTISNIGFEAIPNRTKGNIVIGEFIFMEMKPEDIINAMYHEIGHMLSFPHENEVLADQFAAAHVGPRSFVRTMNNLTSLRATYRKNVMSQLLNSIENVDILKGTICDLQLIADDASKYRIDYLSLYTKQPEAPKIRLYLNQNNEAVQSFVNRNK